MRTLKLTVAYDGTAYAGWQSQKSHKPTLQQTLEAAIERVTGERLRVHASGRTDAGVHALGQVVSLVTESQLATDVLQRALNANLPHDFVVTGATDMPTGFHARRHALRKRYRYVLRDGRVRNVFERGHCWFVPGQLDASAMCAAAEALVGKHDFSSFETQSSRRRSSVRTIFHLDVARDPLDSGRVLVEVEADGFLYNMVRAIVGTLVKVGRGIQPIGWPAQVLAARDRCEAGKKAPPQGLFLLWVQYAEMTNGQKPG